MSRSSTRPRHSSLAQSTMSELLECRRLLSAWSLDFKLRVDFASGYDAARAVTWAGGGKILVAGDASSASNQHDFGVVRLTSTGTLDTSFGAGNGKATANFGGYDVAEAIALTSDQSILVAGSTSAGNGGSYDIAIAKFNNSGILDTSFGGGDGMVTTHIGWGDDRAYAIVPRSNGGFFVAGTARIGGDDDFIVARYTADGSLDGGFNSGFGWRGVDFDRDTDAAKAMSVLSNGKIVLAGTARIDGKDQFAVARINAEGTVDTSFGGGDGMVTTAVGSTNSSGEDLAITSSGKLLVAGSALFSDTGQNFTVLRYSSEGVLDTSFGSGGVGKFYFSQTSNAASGSAIALLSSGKFLVAGIFNIGANSQFGLAQFNSDGSIDKTFGSSGAVSTDFGFGPDGAAAMTVQPSGKIVLVGFGNELNQSTDFAIARYDGNPIAADRFEANNTFATATNLGTLGDRTEANLTIHSASDDDFFRFVATASGQATVKAEFVHVAGDVDLYIYDSAQTELARSAGAGNTESFTINVTGGKTYYVKVIGYLDATNPSYKLSIDGPGSSNHAPTIASLSDSPDPVTAGQKVTLTAKSVADVDGAGTISNVKFYRESNGKSGLQTGTGGDTWLATDTTSPYSCSASTSSLGPGKYTYYARVTDKQGAVSNTVSTSNTVKGPEAAVYGNAVIIKDGDTAPSSSDFTHFGKTTPGKSITRTFTIKNTGTSTLTTSGLKITKLDGTSSSTFKIIDGLSASLAPGGSDTITVRFSQTAIGTYDRMLSFASNDADENPYNFVLRAVVG